MTDFFDDFSRKPHLYNTLSADQKECVHDLRKQKQELLQRNSYLNVEVDELKNTVEQQAEDVRRLRERRNTLNAEVAGLSKENKQLKSDNDTLRQMAQTFAGWYVNAVEEGETLKSKIKGLEDVLEKDHKIISPDTAATMNPEDLVGYRVLDISGRKSAKPKIVTTDRLTDEPTISIKNACVAMNQLADAYQEEIDELKKENETLKAKNEELDRNYHEKRVESNCLRAKIDQLQGGLAEPKIVTSDKLTVTVNAEHIKSELDDLYQDFEELEIAYNNLNDEYSELKEHIKGHVERLAYNYDFKESPNGAGLHYCHDFREIADAVGAEIPYAPFMTARIKAPNVLGDLNNAKIKDLDADKITSGTLKAQEIGKKMSEGFAKGVKEAEPLAVMSDKKLFGDKLASADLGEVKIKYPKDPFTSYWETVFGEWAKQIDKRVANALKQALDIKSPTEPAEGPLKVTKHTHGDGENDGTESDA